MGQHPHGAHIGSAMHAMRTQFKFLHVGNDLTQFWPFFTSWLFHNGFILRFLCSEDVAHLNHPTNNMESNHGANGAITALGPKYQKRSCLGKPRCSTAHGFQSKDSGRVGYGRDGNR